MRRLLFFLLLVALAPLSSPAQSLSIRRTFDEGMLAAKIGRYENALENYRKTEFLLRNEAPQAAFLAKVRFNIGVCLYHLQKPSEAAGDFREAIRLSRNNYQKAFYALGMAEIALKNWRGAIEAFRNAVNLKKEDGEAWFDLALALLEERDFGEAEAAFRHAIKYKSAATADAHNNVGAILALRGDFVAAEKEFKTALIKSNGKSAEAQNNLRLCEFYRQNSGRGEPVAKFIFGKSLSAQENN